MKPYILLLFLIIIIFSCDRTQNQTISRTTPKDTLLQYLRFDTIDIPTRTNLWLSSHLIRMEESNLKLDSTIKDKEVYRMLVLPTFQSPYCLRIEIDKNLKELYYNDDKSDTINLITLMYKNTYGAGGYGGGNLKTSLKVNMPEVDSTIVQEIKNFRNATNNFGFWEEPIARKDVDMTDGTMVIVEGVKEGKYHIIYRHVGDLIFRKNEEKFYPNEFKYKELISFCRSLEKLTYFKDWSKNIDERENEIWKKYSQ